MGADTVIPMLPPIAVHAENLKTLRKVVSD
jgi:hypothetical protein